MDLQQHPDGHTLIGGARWHYPAKGTTTQCAVVGCTRVLGQMPPAAEDEEGERVDPDQ